MSRQPYVHLNSPVSLYLTLRGPNVSCATVNKSFPKLVHTILYLQLNDTLMTVTILKSASCGLFKTSSDYSDIDQWKLSVNQVMKLSLVS